MACHGPRLLTVVVPGNTVVVIRSTVTDTPQEIRSCIAMSHTNVTKCACDNDVIMSLGIPDQIGLKLCSRLKKLNRR